MFINVLTGGSNQVIVDVCTQYVRPLMPFTLVEVLVSKRQNGSFEQSTSCNFSLHCLITPSSFNSLKNLKETYALITLLKMASER